LIFALHFDLPSHNTFKAFKASKASIPAYLPATAASNQISTSIKFRITMKFTQSTLISIFAVIPAAMADFDIYATSSGGNGISANIAGYNFLSGDPSCDEAWNSQIWGQKDDVSGDKYGVRCEQDSHGACAGMSSPSGVTEMEINIDGGEYHFSKCTDLQANKANANRHFSLITALYKERDWGLYASENDGEMGHCYPFPNNDLECADGIGQLFSTRLFRCETIVSPSDIEDNSGFD
jgi:hypothetical protein